MDPIVFVLLTAGLIMLIVGAEALVRGASRMAAAFGVSPLIIGLTVVAFGTSSPELAVSVHSALSGQGDIALGNVVGSNIFNVLFILGLAAVIAPLVVAQQLVRLDVPLLIAVSIGVWLMALDGNLGQWEGGLLFAGIVLYTGFLIWQSRRESKSVQEEYAVEYGARAPRTWTQTVVNILFVLGGLGLLVLGARWLVEGATQLARFFGVSDLIIGLTIIAAGTSLPEVATSVIATLRGERDIAVGNVIGSNLFNLLAVLGLSSLLAPAPGIPVAPGLIYVDLPFMVAVAIACLPIFFTGGAVTRWEGWVFLAYYVAYTVYLVMTATEHAALTQFQTFFLVFIAPLTILTIAVTTLQEIRARKQGAQHP